jgi:GMP synthase-like glutamine amidotransferase
MATLCCCKRATCELIRTPLGAQLLAHVLGAQITSLAQAELGWVRIDLTPAFAQELNDDAHQSSTVLQWHGQTFSLPTGAHSLGASASCAQQGFSLERGAQRLMAVQFHPEWDAQILQNLIAEVASGSERTFLTAALAQTLNFAMQQELTHRLLSYWEGRCV